MPVKPKKIMIRIVFAAGISVMIFGMTGQVAAGEPVFSRALYADQPSFSMPDRNAGLYRIFVKLVHSRNDQDKEVSPALLPAEELKLPPGEPGQTEWEPLKRIGRLPLIEPVPPYNRTGPNQPYLGFGWDRDAGNRNRWNIVFGLGLYISNYQDWYHPAEDSGLEPPQADREQIDLFEKIQNALQVVGFQIRYDF